MPNLAQPRYVAKTFERLIGLCASDFACLFNATCQARTVHAPKKTIPARWARCRSAVDVSPFNDVMGQILSHRIVSYCTASRRQTKCGLVVSAASPTHFTWMQTSQPTPKTIRAASQETKPISLSDKSIWRWERANSKLALALLLPHFQHLPLDDQKMYKGTKGDETGRDEWGIRFSDYVLFFC